VCSEYLDIIALNACKQDICDKILRHFTENYTKWTTIRITRVLASSAVFCELGSAASEQKLSWRKNSCGYRYCIKLTNNWEQYLSELSASFRRKIRIVNQRSQQAGDCSIKLVENKSEVDGMIDKLAHLHTKRWAGANKKGAFVACEFIRFHKEIAKRFFDENCLQLLYIKLNDEVIAMLYNICKQDTIYYYQSGFDLENYKSLSPGILAHSNAIKNAILNDYKFYDFMMGSDDSYKSRYHCEQTEMYNIIFYNNSFIAKIHYFIDRYKST